MLLSAVSVLVVAQSSSEIPEGLMNNPVLDATETKFSRPGTAAPRVYASLSYTSIGCIANPVSSHVSE